MRLEEVEAIREDIRSDISRRRARILAAEATGGDEPPLRVSVGIGLTDVEDVYEVAVRVPDAESAARFRARYAHLFERYKEAIDVRVIGRPRILGGSVSKSLAPHPPSAPNLSIGMKVRHKHGRDGTLGFFAYLGTRLGFVSCNHVIGLTDGAMAGDEILDDAGSVIGSFVTKHRLRGFDRAIADCAFAELANPRFAPLQPGRLRFGVLARRPLKPRQRIHVLKIGASTNVTLGIVKAYGLPDFEVDYHGEFFSIFDDILEIESAERDARGLAVPPGDDGDSGALLFTEKTCQPIGMMFFKTPGGPDNSGLIYASPFENVTRALGVELAI